MGNQISRDWQAMMRSQAKTTPKAGANRLNGFGKRIIKVKVINGREYQYHATKGWRSYRA